MVKRDTRVIPKPCKLINIKNNCFFNSAIQVTLYIHPITTYFISGQFTSKQPICKGFQSFIKSYSECSLLDPQKFINILSPRIKIFNGDEQDAQEFLILFYNKLAIELGLSENIQISNLTELREINKNNIIVKTFYGLICNTIEYVKCNHKSYLTHQFSVLTLSVTESIQESMDTFLKTDFNKNEAKCDKCNKNSKIIVSKEFDSLPDILFIHLSRYYNEKKKNNDFVVINEKLTVQNKVYRPIGYICHSGTLENGHYTAYAKVNGKWYHFDDFSVQEMRFEDCQKRGAYILMYSKI